MFVKQHAQSGPKALFVTDVLYNWKGNTVSLLPEMDV